MTAAILSFPLRFQERPRDWTNQEIAEFHRALDALARSGFEVETDRGLTDEGEPWFVFFRPESDEVIAHFARLDGRIVADAGLLDRPMWASSLREALNGILGEYEVLLPRAPQGGSRLSIHPAAMLTAIVATALMQRQADDPRASTTLGDVRGGRPVGDRGPNGETGGSNSVQTGALVTAALAAIGLAASPVEGTAPGDGTPVAATGYGTHALANLLDTGAPAPDETGLAPLAALVPRDAAESGKLPAEVQPLRGDGGHDPRPITVVPHGDGATEAGPAAVPVITTRPTDTVSSTNSAGAPAAPDTAGEPAGGEPAAPTATAAGWTAAESLRVEPVDFKGVTLDAQGARTVLRALDGRGSDSGSADDRAGEDAESGRTGRGGDGSIPYRGVQPGDGDEGGEGNGADDGGDQPSSGDERQGGNDGAGSPDSGDDGGDARGSGGDAPDSKGGDGALPGLSAVTVEALQKMIGYIAAHSGEAQPLHLDEQTFAGATAADFKATNGSLPDIVAFDSAEVNVDAFPFMPGVIFMDAEAVGPQFEAGEMDSLSVDLAEGGAIELLGVASVEALTA